jgi:hypothetical protein
MDAYNVIRKLFKIVLSVRLADLIETQLVRIVRLNVIHVYPRMPALPVSLPNIS